LEGCLKTFLIRKVPLPIKAKLQALVGSLALLAAISCTAAATSGTDTALTCPDCPLVEVNRVIDGDTFDSAWGRVQLFGVEAPRRGDRCFAEATDRLRQLAGELVRVEHGPRQGGPDGRLLYYVYTQDGASIDELLVREGLALAWDEDGQHRDLLVAVEARAGQEGIGCLW
jgi:endonuclease YncB( thermonuclease family)